MICVCETLVTQRKWEIMVTMNFEQIITDARNSKRVSTKLKQILVTKLASFDFVSSLAMLSIKNHNKFSFDHHASFHRKHAFFIRLLCSIALCKYEYEYSTFVCVCVCALFLLHRCNYTVCKNTEQI